MANIKLRQELEKRIARRCILDLIEAGYTVSVYDGEEVTVKCSTKGTEILAAMMTTDEDYLFAMDANGKREGWVRFIYGNSGWDVINDYTVNLEDALKRTNALIERYA